MIRRGEAGGDMLTDVVIEDPRWEELSVAELAETAARATLEHLGLTSAEWEIAVLACDDARIAALNTEFREKPSPTNVLSWPSHDRAADQPGATPDLPVPGADPELGDIAISYDTCLREAAEAGKAVEAHVMHLMIHATLHLLGYDHIRDQDATLMEATEVTILGKLGLDDPY